MMQINYYKHDFSDKFELKSRSNALVICNHGPPPPEGGGGAGV